MEINCEFNSLSSYRYTCTVNNANITEKNHEIKEFKGVHKKEKSHKDVEGITFWGATVDYFPLHLNKHFPNLTRLIIVDGGITEISKNDLKGLNGLVDLRIFNCQLTSLPDDLFTEMPNLRKVSFAFNKIEFASSELLKPLLGRENVKVNLEGNKNIDSCSWPGYGNSLESLKDLMTLIDEKCIEPAKPTASSEPVISNSKLKEMWISGKFSDLTIIAGDKEFKVHKTILGMKSKVFAQIFEDQSEATEIKLSEFSSKSVEALLKFIYTNEISKHGKAKKNFEIADKFKVAAMKSFYEKVICFQLDESNAWENFLFAHRFSSQQLKKKAFKLIVKNIPEDLPEELMEYPKNLKETIDARKVYEESLEKLKKLIF